MEERAKGNTSHCYSQTDGFATKESPCVVRDGKELDVPLDQLNIDDLGGVSPPGEQIPVNIFPDRRWTLM